MLRLGRLWTSAKRSREVGHPTASHRRRALQRGGLGGWRFDAIQSSRPITDVDHGPARGLDTDQYVPSNRRRREWRGETGVLANRSGGQ